ncbi:MAG TPA: VWA domain-containing protein [Pirellulales bacterium]|nr:VWA domain-containing protein [Pirellulales bacterium]
MSGTLPTWLERWLGVPAAGTGEGTAWSIDSTWPWAPWATLLFVFAAAAWILFWYHREAGAARRFYRWMLAGVRLALVVLLLAMLAGYVLSLSRTGLAYVVVIVDDSASMGTVDRYEDAKLRKAVAAHLKQAGYSEGSRLNLGKSLLLENDAALVKELGRRYKLKLYFVSNSARLQSGDADQLAADVRDVEALGDNTRLGEGIEAAIDDLRGNPPSAVLVFSDGVNTAGAGLADGAAYARRKGVPLFTIALGSETPVRDIELTDLLVDEVVFVDDVVNFEFKLTSSGLEGKEVKVVLRQKDEPTPLVETTMTLPAGGETQRGRLAYRPTEVGEYDYVVEVERIAEENQGDNNRQQRHVSVRKEQVRVLLVQAYPSYEFRYLKHLLERDNTVKLKTVLQEADPEYAQLDETALPVFPVRREELFDYDVLVFGDVNPAFLSATALANIQAFVEEKGGGVVFVCGPLYTPMAYRDTPLAELLPIDFETSAGVDPGEIVNEPFQVQPTEAGLMAPTIQLGETLAETVSVWQKLPPLYWLFAAPALKPAARIWAEHPVRATNDGRHLPVIVMHYAGSGKVVMHATDETWRWRFRVGDVYFARYWVQTIRYLSRSKLLGKDRSAELTTDRREYRRGENVRLRVRFFDERQSPAEDDGVTIIVDREQSQTQRLALQRHATNRGVFEGVLVRPPEGVYHVAVASPTLPGEAPAADFRVVAPPGERARLQTDVAALRRAASDTRGRSYDIATAGRLLRELPEGRQVKTDPLPPLPLWNHWLLMAAFLVLLVGEWCLRKWAGMM